MAQGGFGEPKSRLPRAHHPRSGGPTTKLSPRSSGYRPQSPRFGPVRGRAQNPLGPGCYQSPPVESSWPTAEVVRYGVDVSAATAPSPTPPRSQRARNPANKHPDCPPAPPRSPWRAGAKDPLQEPARKHRGPLAETNHPRVFPESARPTAPSFASNQHPSDPAGCVTSNCFLRGPIPANFGTELFAAGDGGKHRADHGFRSKIGDNARSLSALDPAKPNNGGKPPTRGRRERVTNVEGTAAKT